MNIKCLKGLLSDDDDDDEEEEEAGFLLKWGLRFRV